MRDRFRKVGSRPTYNNDRYEPSEEDRKRRDELRYYRKKASLEEEVAITQAATLLDLMSTFVENLSSSVGFDAVKLGGLANNIQKALEEGSFDLALKSYVSKPELMNLLQNPMLSFASTFTKVVLRTHAENVKSELESGIEGFRAKKRRQEREKPSQREEHEPRKYDNDRCSKSLERSRRRETETSRYSRGRSRSRRRYHRRSRSRSVRRRSISPYDRSYYRRRSRDRHSNSDMTNEKKTDSPADTKTTTTTRPAFVTKTPAEGGGALGAASSVVQQFTPFIGSIKTAMDNNANISAKKDKLETMRPVNKFDVADDLEINKN